MICKFIRFQEELTKTDILINAEAIDGIVYKDSKYTYVYVRGVAEPYCVPAPLEEVIKAIDCLVRTEEA